MLENSENLEKKMEIHGSFQNLRTVDLLRSRPCHDVSYHHPTLHKPWQSSVVFQLLAVVIVDSTAIVAIQPSAFDSVHMLRFIEVN